MKTKNATGLPEVVSHEKWLATSKKLLAKEKKLTRAATRSPRSAAGCRWSGSTRTTSSRGRRQGEPARSVSMAAVSSSSITSCSPLASTAGRTAGCPGCSFVVDNIGHLAHLHARDTSLVLVSRAPLANIERYKQRMGWTVPWFSSAGSDFNADFGLTTDEGETFGLSVFLRDGDSVYRTYFTGGRGVEALGSTWTFLDLTPFGRQEDWEDSPAGLAADPAV